MRKLKEPPAQASTQKTGDIKSIIVDERMKDDESTVYQLLLLIIIVIMYLQKQVLGGLSETMHTAYYFEK